MNAKHRLCTVVVCDIKIKLKQLTAVLNHIRSHYCCLTAAGGCDRRQLNHSYYCFHIVPELSSHLSLLFHIIDVRVELTFNKPHVCSQLPNISIIHRDIIGTDLNLVNTVLYNQTRAITILYICVFQNNFSNSISQRNVCSLNTI